MSEALHKKDKTCSEQGRRFDDELRNAEVQLLRSALGCRSPEAVEAAVAYARFLHEQGVNSENYPLYLRVLEVENHWVIDALVGNQAPFLLLTGVPPTADLVSRILAMITNWQRGAVYAKTLSILLGVLRSVYASPRDGYRVYALSIADLNAVAKHLETQRTPADSLNVVILQLLERISALEVAGDADSKPLAQHATKLRDAFLHDRKAMETLIPIELLAKSDRVPEEIAPRAYQQLQPPFNKEKGENHAEEEINNLYQQLTALAYAGDEKIYQERLARLRSLQKEEARRMQTFFEEQSHLSQKFLENALARADELLERQDVNFTSKDGTSED